MKKQRQNLVVDSDPDVDLKSIICQHSLFFDNLVKLIPARFYLSHDDQDRPWVPGLSKAEKARAKKESRENIKKARRDRLDPDKASATTLDLLKQNLEKEKLENDSDEDDDDDEDEAEENESEDDEVEIIKPMMSGLEEGDCSVTYEELRQRLRRTIEGLRGNRNNGGEPGKLSKRMERRNERKANYEKKRKRDNRFEENNPAIGTTVDEDVQKDVAEASKELTFGYVKLGNEERHGKKKKLSKFVELENAKKLEEAKKDPEKGEIISKKHSWKAATSRAAGIKIHDDPKLIKQSIQKGKKKHQKNVEKWKDRIETQDKKKTEKQQKRSENLAERINQKKMRKIAKREKKLMRPGFEGRKEGFINQSST